MTRLTNVESCNKGAVHLIVALLCVVVSMPSFADELTQDFRREDARLEKRVSLTGERIYVGELLVQLKTQTGVSFNVTRDDPALADILLTVRLSDVPLFDVLNSLWSLVSYRSATCSWYRHGQTEPYTYTIGRSPRGRQYANDMERTVTREFNHHAEVMSSAIKMSPEERSRLGSSDRVAGPLLDSERLRNGLSVFEESFSPAERQSILEGKASIRIPVERLSPSGSAFVESVFTESAGQATRRTLEGNLEPLPKPKYIQAYARRSTEGQIAPVLFIAIEGIGGYGYLGGQPLEKALLDRFDREWLLPGDSITNEALDDKKPTFGAGQAPARGTHPFETSLLTAGNGYGVSFMARIPLKSRQPADSSGSAALKAFMTSLRDMPQHLSAKWRGGVLLLTFHAWFLEEDRHPSWAVVRELRRSMKESDGLLSLEHFVNTCKLQSKLQVHSLADEFPAMNHMALLYSLFRTCANSQSTLDRLQSERGAPISIELAASLSPEATYPVKLQFDTSKMSAIRLKIEDTGEGQSKSREITFGFVSRDNQWTPVYGFSQRAAHP